MKQIIALFCAIFLTLFAPLNCFFDEELGAEIHQPTFVQKARLYVNQFLAKTAQFPRKHKKLTFIAGATLCALTLVACYASMPAPADPCFVDELGNFDLHACMHYLQKSVDTSTLETFTTSAQESLAGLWEQIQDPEKVQDLLSSLWEKFQGDTCHIHIHDEL